MKLKKGAIYSFFNDEISGFTLNCQLKKCRSPRSLVAVLFVIFRNPFIFNDLHFCSEWPKIFSTISKHIFLKFFFVKCSIFRQYGYKPIINSTVVGDRNSNYNIFSPWLVLFLEPQSDAFDERIYRRFAMINFWHHTVKSRYY